MPRWEAVVLGATFGLAGAPLGELLQRVFYDHAETHLDPPAASIVVSTLLIALLAAVGVLSRSPSSPDGTSRRISRLRDRRRRARRTPGR